MSYVKRRIDVSIRLGKGSFGESGADTVTLKGLRVSADISKAGNPSMDKASIRIWGIDESILNTVSTLGKPLLEVRDNYITISAGDDKGVSVVFGGTIQTAIQNFDDAPDCFLFVDAFGAGLDSTKPTDPTSYVGATDVNLIMNNLAARLTPPKQLENSGVTGVILYSPYFPGTLRDQIDSCARAANIFYSIDDTLNVLAIWPKDRGRGGPVPLVSAATGLVGYPRYASQGLSLTSLFLPDVRLGGSVQVESSLTRANGTWLIRSLTYQLESEMPDGAWFVDMETIRPADFNNAP